MNQNFDNNQNFNPGNGQGFAPNQVPNQAQGQGFDPNQAQGQGFAPNQAQGQGFAPNFAPPVDPRIAEGEKKAENSKLIGIVGLISGIICCGWIGIVLQIISFVMAKKSTELLGYEHPDAKTGKICALIGLAIAILSIVVTIVASVLYALGVMEANIAY